MPIEDWTPDPSGQPPHPGDSLRETQLPAIDLAAALNRLDQATRNFTSRLTGAKDLAGTGEPHTEAPPAPSSAPLSDPAVVERAIETRLELAEREAREYLQGARQRVDRLLVAMLDAAERDTAAVRREAEADASHHLDEARRVGDALVAERQRRLAALSDGITGKAEALTAGLEDAEQVRQQFHAFLHALSATASRIATDAAAPVSSAPPAGIRDLQQHASRSALAA